jgi:hypothetical protein
MDAQPVGGSTILEQTTIKCRFWDRVLLILLALLVCVVAVSSGLLALKKHVNSAWFFVAWNSIVMIPVFIRDFRTQLRRPLFVAFLVAWGVAHGFLILGLMHWGIGFVYWPLFMLLEGTVGLLVANHLFDIRPAAE